LLVLCVLWSFGGLLRVLQLCCWSNIRPWIEKLFLYFLIVGVGSWVCVVPLVGAVLLSRGSVLQNFGCNFNKITRNTNVRFSWLTCWSCADDVACVLHMSPMIDTAVAGPWCCVRSVCVQWR
jgi:hypothetical protein